MTFLLILTIHLLNELYTPNEEYDFAIAPLVGAALISGAAGLLNGVINRNSQETYNDRMIRLQKETNYMNYLMNQQNNAYNSMLAKEMFNLENEYNDPKNQMARLRSAGINPFVAAGGSNIGQVEGRADTVPAQSPLPMQNPAQGTVAPQLDFATSMSQIASAFASLAQAKKNVGDDRRADASLDAMIDNLKAEADLKSEQALQARWNNVMQFKYADKRAQKDLRLLDAQWAKANQDMTESEARTWLTQMQAMIAEVERDTKDAELKSILPYLSPMAKAKYENILKEGHVLDTQARSNIASANASNASANASNTQSQLNVSKAKAQNIINKYLPQLSAWQVVSQQYETYGKALVNKKTAQEMVIQAKKFLPEIRELFAKGSEIYKNIEYLQGQIDKLPHEIDKIDSETWRNFCSGMNDLMKSADIFTDMVVPF